MKKFILIFLSLVLLFNLLNAQNTWQETAILQASDYGSGDLFGNSVAIDGNYAIVAAFRNSDDENGNNLLQQAGAAYIYENDGNGNWTEAQKLVPNDRNAYDYFGNAVAISGNQAIVACYFDDEDENEQNPMPAAGAVYIFERQSSGYWQQVQKLVASDRDTLDLFGYSLAVDEQQMVIGAIGQDLDENGENYVESAGAVYVFEKDINGIWSEKQKLVSSNRLPNEKFGFTLDVYNKNLVISEPNYSPNGDAHHYYIYRNINENWQLVGSLGYNLYTEKYAIAINDNFLFIGDDDDNKIETYKLDSINNSWNEINAITHTEEAYALSNFGQSLDCNNENLIVSATNRQVLFEVTDTTNASESFGVIYNYQINNNADWELKEKIIASNKIEFDSLSNISDPNFGETLHISKSNNNFIASKLLDVDWEDGVFFTIPGYTFIFEYDLISSINNQTTLVNINFYPNPISEFVEINLLKPFSKIDVEILNLNNQIVFKTTHTNVKNLNLNLKLLLAGKYLLQILNGDKIIAQQKFIKL